MALRIDFFRSPGEEPAEQAQAGDDLAEFDPAELVALGFVAASDPDEDELYYLLENVLAPAGVTGVAEQGWGFADLDTVAAARTHLRPAAAEAGEAMKGWLATIAAALASAEHAAAAIYWHTSFDVAGSVDAGTDEFTTGWSAV